MCALLAEVREFKMSRLVIATVLGLLALASRPAFAQFYGPGQMVRGHRQGHG